MGRQIAPRAAPTAPETGPFTHDFVPFNPADVPDSQPIGPPFEIEAMPGPLSFRRVVVGFDAAHLDTGRLDIAAELAAALNVGLTGLFAASRDLERLAGLPFARAFDPFRRDWQDVGASQMAESIAECAQRAERALAAAAVRQALAPRLEPVANGLAEAVAAYAGPDDILVVIEPGPGRASDAFTRSVLESALRSPAAVLFVPAGVWRRPGAVLAIAGGPDDPALSVARDLAAATGRALVALRPDDAFGDINDAPEARTGASAMSRGAFRGATARRRPQPGGAALIVVSRETAGPAAAAAIAGLAQARHSPVLVIETPAQDRTRPR